MNNLEKETKKLNPKPLVKAPKKTLPLAFFPQRKTIKYIQEDDHGKKEVKELEYSPIKRDEAVNNPKFNHVGLNYGGKKTRKAKRKVKRKSKRTKKRL